MKKEHRRSVLDIMLFVAEAGMLRKNKEELIRMESFMKGASFGKLGIWEITDNQILYAFWEDDHFSPVYDITIEVLTDLYGDEDEKNKAMDDGMELSIEFGCDDYMIDESFEVDLSDGIRKKEVE